MHCTIIEFEINYLTSEVHHRGSELRCSELDINSIYRRESQFTFFFIFTLVIICYIALKYFNKL